MRTHALLHLLLLLPVLVLAGTVGAQTGSVELYGKGCGGATGAPTIGPAAGSVPSLGGDFTIEIGSMPPGVNAACLMISCIRRQTPIDLASAGLPGCELWIMPELFYEVVPPVVFRLPSQPVYLGLAVQYQALVTDPSQQPVPVAFTQAMQAVIGR